MKLQVFNLFMLYFALLCARLVLRALYLREVESRTIPGYEVDLPPPRMATSHCMSCDLVACSLPVPTAVKTNMKLKLQTFQVVPGHQSEHSLLLVL